MDAKKVITRARELFGSFLAALTPEHREAFDALVKAAETSGGENLSPEKKQGLAAALRGLEQWIASVREIVFGRKEEDPSVKGVDQLVEPRPPLAGDTEKQRELDELRLMIWRARQESPEKERQAKEEAARKLGIDPKKKGGLKPLVALLAYIGPKPEWIFATYVRWLLRIRETSSFLSLLREIAANEEMKPEDLLEKLKATPTWKRSQKAAQQSTGGDKSSRAPTGQSGKTGADQGVESGETHRRQKKLRSRKNRGGAGDHREDDQLKLELLRLRHKDRQGYAQRRSALMRERGWHHKDFDAFMLPTRKSYQRFPWIARLLLATSTKIEDRTKLTSEIAQLLGISVAEIHKGVKTTTVWQQAKKK